MYRDRVVLVLAVVLVSWPGLAWAQTSSAASTARQTDPKLGFLTNYRFHLNAFGVVSGEEDFVWDTDFGGDIDIFDLERRRLELYKEYMKAENRMQEGIKRDVVIKSDYDPYAWKKHAVRYQGGQKLNDPVKRDLEKMYEDKLGPAGGRGEIPHHRTRVMIDPQMYDGAKLKGTPHGSVAPPSLLP